MQTDSVYACNIENNDQILIDGHHVGYVYSIEEEGDFIHLDVVDDEAEHTIYPFGPFDTVTIVTSFDDGEVIDIPDFME